MVKAKFTKHFRADGAVNWIVYQFLALFALKINRDFPAEVFFALSDCFGEL